MQQDRLAGQRRVAAPRRLSERNLADPAPTAQGRARLVPGETPLKVPELQTGRACVVDSLGPAGFQGEAGLVGGDRLHVASQLGQHRGAVQMGVGMVRIEPQGGGAALQRLGVTPEGLQGGGAMVVQECGAPVQGDGAVVVGQGLLETAEPAQQDRPVVQRIEEAGVHGDGPVVGLHRLVHAAQFAQAVGQVAVGGWIAGIERDRALQALDPGLELARLQGDQAHHVVADGAVRIELQQRLERAPRLLQPPLLEQLQPGLDERLGRRGRAMHGAPAAMSRPGGCSARLPRRQSVAAARGPR